MIRYFKFETLMLEVLFLAWLIEAIHTNNHVEMFELQLCPFCPDTGLVRNLNINGTKN